MENHRLEPNSPDEHHRSVSFEEIANSISHGFGLLLAIAFLTVLLLSATRLDGFRFLVGSSVFGGTMVLVYLSSTLYHSITHKRAKHIFRMLDHSAVFLLIAGTYTPFAIG